MNKLNLTSCVFGAILTLAIAGCGGGSSSSSNGSTTEPNVGSPSQAAAKLDHTCQIPNFNAEFTARINAFRHAGAVCGGEVMGKVGPLKWNQKLQNAAMVHAKNMADLNFFAHTGLDGSTPELRGTAAGYVGGVGENIQAGSQSIEQSFTGWANSPGHCKNMMRPDYQEYAVSCAENANSSYGRYWVMDLGVPR